ncbi:subtilisin-like protein [Thozetella sp. PMI_491]|nr:subtilisin-like protein [Thozetella sp. PMI_491]
MKGSAFLTLLPLVLASPATPITKRVGGPAPILRPRGDGLIEGKYIVKLRTGSTAADISDAISLIDGRASHTYHNDGFKGFAAALDDTALQALTNHPTVEYVEQDAIVTASAYVTQTSASWGLARISHHTLNYNEYTYDSSAGEGTCVYVIDSGINTAHNEFQGRATQLANFIDSNNVDNDGHGTHVAGLIGGVTYGVAKKTKLYSIKMLANSQSTVSAAVAAMDFAVTDSKTRSCPKGIVASLAWNYWRTESLDDAAEALAAAGIVVTASAGDYYNAGFYSPYGVDLCVIGASNFTGTQDTRGSGWGNYVSVFAPGINVPSAWIGSTSATSVQSGSSMATGVIAGLSAYLLALLGPKTSVDMCNYIISTSQLNMMTGTGEGGNPIFQSPNRLAFNGNPSA